jgi:hypothetical protein
MDADVAMTNRLPGVEIGAEERRDAKLSDDDGCRRSCGAQRCERNRVLPRVALLNSGGPIILMCRGMRGRNAVSVRGQAVVVLGMIVVGVVVRVQQRPRARGRHQHQNEQQRQRAMHDDESMRRGAGRSKADPADLLVFWPMQPPSSQPRGRPTPRAEPSSDRCAPRARPASRRP